MTKKKEKWVPCTFVSVWDDESTELESKAEVNLITGEINVLETHSGEKVSTLDREYIKVIINDDEKEFDVCSECHNYVEGFQGMWDDGCGDYCEHHGCPACSGDPLHRNWYQYG